MIFFSVFYVLLHTYDVLDSLGWFIREITESLRNGCPDPVCTFRKSFGWAQAECICIHMFLGVSAQTYQLVQGGFYFKSNQKKSSGVEYFLDEGGNVL